MIRIQTDVYNTRAIHPGLFPHMIMVAIGRNYHHSVIRFRMYDDDGYLISDWIFEAVGEGFLPTRYNEWIKDNKIILKCDLTKKKSLSLQIQQSMLERAKKLANKGTKYGNFSIVGIVFWYFLKAKTVGVDGDARVICSEAIYIVCDGVVESSSGKPTDYINPRDLEADFFN